jgi:hypothetical protein
MLSVMREKFGSRISYCDKYNNLHLEKTVDADLDVTRTREILEAYPQRAKDWIEDMLAQGIDFDFCISDFVPEAFELARRLGKPAFGVAHFTWDWFYENISHSSRDVVQQMEDYIRTASQLYFPPFTPPGVLKKYGTIATHVPFVINELLPMHIHENGFKILVMDNGTKTLARLIGQNISTFTTLTDFLFFLSTEFVNSPTKNLRPIHGLKTIHSCIPHMDLVVARAGFNTITECLANRIPGLFVEESSNPEVNENLRLVTERGLASRISLYDFKHDFANRLAKFLKSDYSSIRKKLYQTTFSACGAQVICHDIFRKVGINHD